MLGQIKGQWGQAGGWWSQVGQNAVSAGLAKAKASGNNMQWELFAAHARRVGNLSEQRGEERMRIEQREPKEEIANSRGKTEARKEQRECRKRNEEIVRR